MTKKIKFATATVIICGLSACGGGSGDSLVDRQQVFDIKIGNDDLAFDPNTGVLTLDGEEIGDRTDRAIAALGDAKITNRVNTPIFAAVAQNSDVFAATFQNFDPDDQAKGTIYGRRGEADLPSSGEATYTGNYAGLSVRAPDSATPAISAGVTGVAVFTADFSGMTMDGEITGRTVVAPNGVPFANAVGAEDVVLEITDLGADGRFSGSASGGEFTQIGATFEGSAGEYEGFIGRNFGGSDTSVAGAFSMDHEKSDGNIYRETGVFVAN
ncbi:hypothetical protein [Yoonia sediminilitoris]|uniref:Transferrin-binding protein B C-lobe/N-lobe beta barrel domain-containing protein n=1 Tax=Yoonia sediminilitoris TaxID=1286148 RepID=A0A2T6KPZ4_9RHOB|nr:hypothetical protein [Yoonia sediminilitoris]PUB18617.1 hypothetical protein C8N45_101201 [Yoonia sediminilitoris]RCW98785.1 hypothetical protein DFP92_101201 [Yoonia sediminilitoris]